jgi:hypothetical protein
MPEETLTEREELIMHEAFMVGRVYAARGEKESPTTIHEKLRRSCLAIIKRGHLSQPRKEGETPGCWRDTSACKFPVPSCSGEGCIFYDYGSLQAALADAGHSEEQLITERTTLENLLSEKEQEIATADKLLSARNAVLDKIPECPAHGTQCMPHCEAWISSAKAALEAAWQVVLSEDMEDYIDGLVKALEANSKHNKEHEKEADDADLPAMVYVFCGDGTRLVFPYDRVEEHLILRADQVFSSDKPYRWLVESTSLSASEYIKGRTERRDDVG